MDTSKTELLTAGFEIVTLPVEQKIHVFSEAVSSIKRNTEEAELILSSLQRCAPDLAQPFVRRTADTILDTPFRVVREAQAEQGPTSSYLCVSYCWQRENFKGSDVEPGAPFPFSQPFVDAVLHLRTSSDEGIWVDQLCIQQQDEAEKLRAIATMGEYKTMQLAWLFADLLTKVFLNDKDIVYKSCRRLVILLEDTILDEKEVAMAEKYDGAKLNFDVTWVPEPEDVNALVSLCNEALRSRWWTRSWCYHEFAVNEPWSAKRCDYDMHNAVFVLGTQDLPLVEPPCTSKSLGTITVRWITLQTIVGHMMLLYPGTLGLDLEAPGMAFLSGLEDKTSPINDPVQRTYGSTKSSILSKFHAVTLTNCSLPQDRLSITLNLSSLGLAVGRQIREDLVELTAVALSLVAGEKQALTFVNSSPNVIDGDESWFTPHHAGRSTAMRKFVLGSNQRIQHISPKRIELDLLFFNYPVSPQATEAEIAITRKVFPDTIPITKPAFYGHTGNMFATYRSDEELQPHIRRFLANCLRLGLEYIARLWRVLYQEVIVDSYSTGPFASFEANANLEANAESLRSLSTDASVLSLQDATLFLTWLTDLRSEYYISVLSFVIPCTASGDGALITSTIIRQGFVDKSIRFAIPRDLVGHHCEQPRVWVLSPAEGSGFDAIAEGCPWHIVGKALLLGEPDLMAEMERDVLSEQKGMLLAHRQVVRW